tara:strand:+ start:3578 stop:3892 length:315 start_codon:yes stop_codon:yes gene_type:complete
MPKRTKKYEDSLTENLKDPVEAAAYLNAYLEDVDDPDEEGFLLALKDVAKAYGMSNVANATNLGRESLYKSLSADGNPKLTTLVSLLNSMGLNLSVNPKGKESA